MATTADTPNVQSVKATDFLWWTIYPPPDKELAHLPEAERRELSKAALRIVRKKFKSWRWQLVIVAWSLMLVLYPSICFLCWKYFGAGQFSQLAIDLYIVQAAGWLIGCLLLHWFLYRKTLRQLLLDQGIRPRFCFECRCNVEGREGHSCPQCGTALLNPVSSQAAYP